MSPYQIVKFAPGSTTSVHGSSARNRGGHGTESTRARSPGRRLNRRDPRVCGRARRRTIGTVSRLRATCIDGSRRRRRRRMPAAFRPSQTGPGVASRVSIRCFPTTRRGAGSLARERGSRGVREAPRGPIRGVVPRGALTSANRRDAPNQGAPRADPHGGGRHPCTARPDAQSRLA